MLTLKEFIATYDKEDSIVLLEGKREVLDNDRDKLEALGKLLVSNTSKMIFRSGNATGADIYFSKGILTIDSSRLQVVTSFLFQLSCNVAIIMHSIEFFLVNIE